jgi:protein gp37
VLSDPYAWKHPRMVFVNSMSDLFHPDVPNDYVQRVFEVMNTTPHVYQVLTKRPERLLDKHLDLFWTPNIWMGTSIENVRVLSRLEHLRASGAANRFLSLEPLLGPLDNLDLQGIHWVIVGGESGPRARPIRKEWIVSIQRQCADAAVPFFFKQWGNAASNDDPRDPTTRKAHPTYAKGGCQLDGAVFRSIPC